MKSIYLTGFMGAGKTSIGKALGEKMSLPIYDTDSYIEKNEGCSIKEIFDSRGEEKFRFLEEQTLRELPITNSIIMTGGGIISRQSNIEWMKVKGVMLFLYCDINTIMKRLENDVTRPLVHKKSIEEINMIYSKRLPLYHQAHLTIDISDDTLQEATEKVYQAIKSWQSGQH
ncbi:shikimate kinase [Sutcliffiella halmapala]|uniref:shikimate kinase n=1 Tax=Sutcliffiella halmapala TaxID=79882 RepID=UPI0009955A0F|nr:shikimate kinase [Sutcliffiella halmapala]